MKICMFHTDWQFVWISVWSYEFSNTIKIKFYGEIGVFMAMVTTTVMARARENML